MQLSMPVRWFVHGSLAILAIWLGSTYLIRYGTTPSSTSKKTENSPVKFPSVNEARFRSLLDTGTKAICDGHYTDALSSFAEAERSGDRLSDEQYESLKKARLQVAQLYEAADDRPSANTVYRALADCAVREGNNLVQAKDYASAVKRARDGEEFSNHLIEGKRDSLQGSLLLLASSLSLVHRYPDAAEAAQRLIEYLKSVDECDHVLGQAYSMLAGIQGDAKDWPAMDQALTQYIDWCDRTHEHLIAESRGPYIDTTLERSWAQYNLIIARYQEGDPDSALSKADDFFNEYLQKEREATPARPLSVAFHSGDFAALALQIAKESNRPNAIDLWQKRAPGGIKIIALHPPDTH
jgi:hypothetical protein